MAILAAAAAFSAIGAPAANALATAERGRPLAAISVASCLFGVGAATAGMWLNDLVGAAYGVLLTEALGCAARWRALNGLVLENARSLRPSPVLDARELPLC